MTNAIGDFVRVSRLIRAPKQQVYDAWLDPEVRKLWWGASPEMTCSVCEINAEVGGTYRVGMVEPNGREHVAVGQFLELDSPNKMRCTLTWEGEKLFAGETILTLEFFDAEFKGEPATEVLLVHEKLAQPLERSDHTTGWLGCLKNLGAYYAGLAKV